VTLSSFIRAVPDILKYSANMNSGSRYGTQYGMVQCQQ